MDLCKKVTSTICMTQESEGLNHSPDTSEFHLEVMTNEEKFILTQITQKNAFILTRFGSCKLM